MCVMSFPKIYGFGVCEARLLSNSSIQFSDLSVVVVVDFNFIRTNPLLGWTGRGRTNILLSKADTLYSTEPKQFKLYLVTSVRSEALRPAESPCVQIVAAPWLVCQQCILLPIAPTKALITFLTLSQICVKIASQQTRIRSWMLSTHRFLIA